MKKRKIRIGAAPREGHLVKRISKNKIWGLGVYINPDHYKYVALQLGPYWIYIYHESGFED